MLSSIKPLMGDYTDMRLTPAQRMARKMGSSFADAAKGAADQSGIARNQRYDSATAQAEGELLTACEKLAIEKTAERMVYGTEQVDALLDSAGYARVSDMDTATLYDKLSDTSRNVLDRIETGRNDITKDEWTAFCKELRDLGAITDKAFGAVRRDFTLIPIGYKDKNGKLVTYSTPPYMVEQLRGHAAAAGVPVAYVASQADNWSGDPIAYFDAWFKTMREWRSNLAGQRDPDGTPKYDNLAPLDDQVNAWGEISALLDELLGQ